MNDFNVSLYKEVAFREKLEVFTNQNTFKSNRHNMFLQSVRKKAFDAFDDKRFILPNGIETLAHGHYKIPDIIKNWETT